MTATSPDRPVADVAAGLRGPNAVAGLGTVLGVWAHPDDEAYLSGGLMAAAVDAGSRVVCVTATRGELGSPDGLGLLREAELTASLAVLGVTEHHQLGYPDGGCTDVPMASAVARLVGIIEEVQPDTVLTFGPDGITGHADHRVVGAWTAAAVRESGLRPRLFHAANIDAWCDRFAELNARLQIYSTGLPLPVPAAELAIELDLPEDLLDRKLRALHAHASQVDPLVAILGEELFRSWIAQEGFRPAEGFG